MKNTRQSYPLEVYRAAYIDFKREWYDKSVNSKLLNALDARQTNEWGKYLKHLGWRTEKIGATYIFLRRIPLIGRSMIKIQHPAGPVDLDKVEQHAKQEKALFTIIEPHNKGYAEDDYVKNGYRKSKIQFAHTATIKIDLTQSEEKIYSAFSTNAKRNIKKAEAHLSIKAVNLKDGKDAIVQQFYGMYAGTGKEKKFYVPPYSEVSAKIRAFSKTSYILFAYEKKSLEKEQKPVAVLWVGHFDNVLVYFHPGNTKRGYELLANYFLVWEALRLGKRLGLQVFDFETMYDNRDPKKNKAWKGYTEFKKKFGGEEVYYPQVWIKVYNPIFRLLYSFATFFS